VRQTLEYLRTGSREINLVDLTGAPEAPVLRFHVDRKLGAEQLEARGLDALPRSIGEVPAEIVVGKYWLQRFGATRLPAQRRLDPLVGGISISREGQMSAGTLGALVYDNSTGVPLLLSNFHVLAGKWGVRPGTQRIVQPGVLDGGDAGDAVATYLRDAMDDHLDAAVAGLNGSRSLVATQYGIGEYHGRTPPVLGQRLVKYGRTSGETEGVVSGIAGQAMFSYGSIRWRISDVISIDPVEGSSIVSEPGDSGSCWLDWQTHAPVGLHFAGSDQPERALALDLGAVCRALDVDLPA
jgi:endonuclease G